MSLQNPRQLANTRKKLQDLEAHYAQAKERVVENPLTHELSLRSLKRMINQLKEEIALYEARALSSDKK